MLWTFAVSKVSLPAYAEVKTYFSKQTCTMNSDLRTLQAVILC